MNLDKIVLSSSPDPLSLFKTATELFQEEHIEYIDLNCFPINRVRPGWLMIVLIEEASLNPTSCLLACVFPQSHSRLLT